MRHADIAIVVTPSRRHYAMPLDTAASVRDAADTVTPRHATPPRQRAVYADFRRCRLRDDMLLMLMRVAADCRWHGRGVMVKANVRH